MIVSGSLQSLYLIGNVLIDKEDVVYLENPTFPNVISIFKSLRANVIPVEMDAEGLLVEKMEEIPGKKPKLVHVTPSNQYPLGGKMSLDRRNQLLDWANRNEALIIENDYEHEINNWQDPIASIFSLDRQQRTIYLGTFNRTLHPSIRLGYMILPPILLPAVKALQMHSHRFVPQSIQAVMTDFIRQNLIYKHLRNVVEEAADRKQLFLSLFEKHFDESILIRMVDNSSFHLVAELNENTDDQQLVSALEAKGIVTHALSKCYIGPDKKRGLILGYSCINRGFMAQFVARMAGVYFGKG
jgi:GntR family transcriptional regulator/MocR family aminotransferase